MVLPLRLLDWSLHTADEHWPRSSERVFIAAAIQRLGHLNLDDWTGNEPHWANHHRHPFLPAAEIAFENERPVEKVHRAFASIIRSYRSPAVFEARQLARQIEAQVADGAAPNPDLEGQVHAADLRAYLNEDQDDPITRTHWAEVWWELLEIDSKLDGAESRLPLVADQLIHLAQRSRLKTFARLHGGGDVVPIEPALWEIDNDICLRRLAAGSINLDAPLVPEAPPTHWIFVDEADLDREMQAYDEQQRRALEKPRQPLGSLVEGTLNDCATWLMQQFEDPACPSATKEEFFTASKRVFGASLSERGFLRAWQAATIEYPTRRIPGPRSARVKSAR